MATEKKAITVYLDEWTEAQAKDFAEKNDRSMSWVLGYAAKSYFCSLVAKDARPASARAIEDARQIHIEDAIAAAKKTTKRPARGK